MSYCLNPHCKVPRNPNEARFCASCGGALVLGDRYLTKRPIGRGGFGRTFLAIDLYKPSHPPCVIKQFFPKDGNVGDLNEARQMFEREAIQQEQLGRHPQIPELLAHFEAAGYQYLVQQYIQGLNLSQEAGQRGHFYESDIWQLLLDLLPVLEFIHNHQVIHRDIKPQNIIRRQSDEQYFLVDFGAAKAMTLTNRDRTATSIGSPEFISPEQAMGKPIFASDLYSLGVTCIYLLTLVRPADLFDINEGGWAWRKFLPNPVTTELGRILDKLLKGPTKYRYVTAAEVLTDIAMVRSLAVFGVGTPAVMAAMSLDYNSLEFATAPTRHHRKAAGDDDLGGGGQPLKSSRPVVHRPALGPDAGLLARPDSQSSFQANFQANFPPDFQATSRSDSMASGGDFSLWPLADSGALPLVLVAPASLGNTRWEPWQSLTAHRNWVRSVVMHPSGRVMVSGSGDKTLKFWRIQTGELIRTLEAHDSWIRGVATSPQGNLLASCSNDGVVKLWKWRTGEPVRQLKGHQEWVRGVAFSPDGQVLASCGQDKQIRLWSVLTGDCLRILQGHEHWVTAVNFIEPSVHGEDPLLVSSGRDQTVRVWNWQTGELLQTLVGHSACVNAIAISPDHSLIASASDDQTVRLWDLDTGELLRMLTGHRGGVTALAIDTRSNLLVSSGQDKRLMFWDFVSGALKFQVDSFTSGIWSVALQPNGDAIATGNWDGTVNLWRRQTAIALA